MLYANLKQFKFLPQYYFLILYIIIIDYFLKTYNLVILYLKILLIYINYNLLKPLKLFY